MVLRVIISQNDFFLISPTDGAFDISVVLKDELMISGITAVGFHDTLHKEAVRTARHSGFRKTILSLPEAGLEDVFQGYPQEHKGGTHQEEEK